MNARLDIFETPIEGLKLVRRNPLSDGRGYLERVFCAQEMDALLDGKCIVQINRTYTAKRGTVRGMHFQHAPYSEIKLVSCLRGEVYDVAVDLRRGSPTFLLWHSEILSAANCRTLVIPEGFAHGFQTLTDDCEMLYLHTAPYQASAEAGLNARDRQLSIPWPLPIADQSVRDSEHPMVSREFEGISP